MLRMGEKNRNSSGNLSKRIFSETLILVFNFMKIVLEDKSRDFILKEPKLLLMDVRSSILKVEGRKLCLPNSVFLR